MRRLYYRSTPASPWRLGIVLLVAIASLLALEKLPRVHRQPYHATKLGAARLAASCMAAIREEKLRRGIVSDPEADPAHTGMLGSGVTRITSNTGHLPSKMTSTNPNFAAVVVHLLRGQGVSVGDVVAVGLSGSFPAMNVAVLSALQVLKAEPIVIASAASSVWGATDEDYLWLDMERTLFDRHLIGFRSVAASRGGIDDRGFGITREGRVILDEAIERAGIQKLEPHSLTEAIDQRMQVYFEHAKGRPIAAYINVGGGSASVGTAVGKRLFRPGLSTVAPKGAPDSVMARFLREGVAVVHLSGINRLATEYGLPIAPRASVEPGEGGIYATIEYSPWVASGGVVAVFAALTGLLRSQRQAPHSNTNRPRAVS